MEHWVNGWVDWNLILDETGGPNYSNNTVDAAIIANIGITYKYYMYLFITLHSLILKLPDKKEFYKQPMFYAIGHFSRFVVQDSVRLDVKSTHNDVLSIGFQRPDKSIALIIFNK